MKKFTDIILLVPNTGFKMFFFPLGTAFIADKDIKEACKLNRDLASLCPVTGEVIGYSDDWQTKQDLYHLNSWTQVTHPVPLKYIRYRFGICRQGIVEFEGLWLAIETNLGTADRGWKFDESKPSPGEIEHYARFPNPVHPYFKADQNAIPVGDEKTKIFIEGRLIALNLRWSNTFRSTSKDVDLVIDFGNSRTAVLALEYTSGAAKGDFAQSCRPLALKPSFYSTLTKQTHVDDAIVSSRFVLKSPEFRRFDPDDPTAVEKSDKKSDFLLYTNRYTTSTAKQSFLDKLKNTPPKKEVQMVERLVPHMFTKISPVCLGDDMEELIHGATELGSEAKRRMQSGELLQQSSAKRYFWDSDLCPQPWSCVPNYGDGIFGEREGLGRISPLSGLMLKFQPENGKSWGDQGMLPCDWEMRMVPSIFPSSPCYPRRNTLTWTVLSIMETAHRQINDANWTQHAGKFEIRTIRNIIATYPSGWTRTEIDEYRAKWLEAIRIFQATNLASGEPEIQLQMRMDEAVASQLPLIYSSIDRLASQAAGENWIGLYGRNIEGELPKLRVMNLDIGGGTSDISVVEYYDKQEGIEVDLSAKVLFKDSSTAAGDILVRSIINKIVIPNLLSEFPEKLPEAKRYFSDVLSVNETSYRISILTGSLLPIAIHIMKERCSGKWTAGELVYNPKDSGATNIDLFYGTILKSNATKIYDRRHMVVTTSQLDALVEEVFGKFVRSLAKYASTYDVDMLMVCGKPSEQPAISDMIKRMMPISNERILFTKGFKAGAWYPFKDGEDYQISDAKSVTCVGAALERAMNLQIIRNWKISISNESGVRNIWGEMPMFGPKFSRHILSSGDDQSAEITLTSGTRIGRKMFAVNTCFPEPVYRLVWLDSSEPVISVRVVFKRVNANAAETDDNSDGLELVSVVDASTGDDLMERLVLKLYPIGQDSMHWTDTGKLD